MKLIIATVVVTGVAYAASRRRNTEATTLLAIEQMHAEARAIVEQTSLSSRRSNLHKGI